MSGIEYLDADIGNVPGKLPGFFRRPLWCLWHIPGGACSVPRRYTATTTRTTPMRAAGEQAAHLSVRWQ